jgi:hypothetical protein
MGEYLIKSTLAISFAYLLYMFFMRKGTNFRWHRLYLTGVMFIALALPAVYSVLPVHQQVIVHLPEEYIQVFVPQAVSPVEEVVTTDLIATPAEHHSAFTLSHVIGSVYFIGLLLVIVWKCIGFLQLAKLVFRHGVCRREKCRFVFIKDLPSPFSFFRLIFIDPQQFQNESNDVLLEHETVHVRQWHSVDLILLEVVTAIHWFNPLVWHMKRTLTEVHEFLADQSTIGEKCPPLEYKRVLLSMVCGFDVRLPVHGMSSSLTKKRIQMITNNKQNKKWFAILVFFLVAIIATGSFSSVAFARYSNISQKIAEVVKKDIVTKTVSPQYDVVAQSVPGWFKAGSKPNSYKVGIDKTIFKSGGSSAFMESTEPKIDGFGTLMQTCSAQDYLGKRVKMTGYIKSENVTVAAGMWLRVDSKSRTMLSFDNMQDRPIKGNNDWTKCEIILDVPEESETLNFGVLMSGTGKVWFDDISFEIVDKQNTKTTGNYVNPSKPANFPGKPANIDFEK